MNVNDELIKQVVGAVMRKLADRSVSCASNGADTSLYNKADICEAVVTEETLRSRVNRSGVIRIGKNSVLTPSALDFLRTNQISWQRVEMPNVEKREPASQSRWHMISVDRTESTDQLMNDLYSGQWSQVSAADCAEAAAKGISAICRAEATDVLIISQQPVKAACLANRNDKVRAVVLKQAGDVVAAIKELNPNLWAINPLDRSYFELKNLLKTLMKK